MPEDTDGECWIVIHDGGKRHPVPQVAAIPACFDAMAEYNVSNAMHAIAARHFLGVRTADIAAAMSSFHSDIATTPGRLNIHDTGRFRVIMDFAHNPDGMREFCAFVDRQEVGGRKILMFWQPGDRSDEEIQLVARAAAGHFDHYICRGDPYFREREGQEPETLLRAGLLQEGVAAEHITVIPDPSAAVQSALRMSQAGDLVIIRTSVKEMHGHWEQITAA